MSLTIVSKAKAAQVSRDGYIRMTFETFIGLEFTLRKSWKDVALYDDLRSEGFEVCHAGYCEWETETSQAVSIGWAWFECPNGRRAIAPGGISTNVMLVTAKSQYDLGQRKTDELLQAWLDGEHWQPDECTPAPVHKRLSS